jgi:hypothetical protein
VAFRLPVKNAIDRKRPDSSILIFDSFHFVRAGGFHRFVEWNTRCLQADSTLKGENRAPS